MKKNIILVITSTALTLIVALSIIRWFAPRLLGITPDLQLVRVAKKVPPFFDNIFRENDYNTDNFIISDPYIKRAKPLYPDRIKEGPNDLLGFRNRQIPNVADIITIGDSQTYGNNAPLEKNWPNQSLKYLTDKSPTLYSMATGGWGAAEYLEILSKAKFFKPRIIIVAFYSGNDPLESFVQVYGRDYLSNLRPDPQLTANDAPELEFPVPISQCWPVMFRDGISTVFTPKVRHLSNNNHPAAIAGWSIMENIAYEISKRAKKENIKIIFLILPTKELVYAKKVQEYYNSSIKSKADYFISFKEQYLNLVRDEYNNIKRLAKSLEKNPDAIYVDVIESLQDAALKPQQLYPQSSDGHPLPAGYQIIAKALSPTISKLLPSKPEGGIVVNYGGDDIQVFLVRDGYLWNFSSKELFHKNGWRTNLLRSVSIRDIANIPFGGTISTVSTKWAP